MAQKIVIVDYGMGNLHSLYNAFKLLKISAIISSDSNEIGLADKLILPGVGNFTNAIKNLNQLNIIDTLNKQVLVNKKSVLGICLGMQLMGTKSEEGNANGLGWINNDVIKFKVTNKLKYKVPHIGWNQISIKNEKSLLMKHIPNLSEFYFLHAYHFNNTNTINVLNETNYEYNFISAIEKDNIFGVQYHPEKSHDAGSVLLKNFVNL
jgi:imidazole glycerol-phosphate synthase subunit HisH